jgi:hypothetical protein
MPPAGFEPALRESVEGDTPGAVTGKETLPEALRMKLDVPAGTPSRVRSVSLTVLAMQSGRLSVPWG